MAPGVLLLGGVKCSPLCLTPIRLGDERKAVIDDLNALPALNLFLRCSFRLQTQEAPIKARRGVTRWTLTPCHAANAKLHFQDGARDAPGHSPCTYSL